MNQRLSEGRWSLLSYKGSNHAPVPPQLSIASHLVHTRFGASNAFCGVLITRDSTPASVVTLLLRASLSPEASFRRAL